MQERYVSLDPQFAESENAKLRKEIFNQRLYEARGGDPNEMLKS